MTLDNFKTAFDTSFGNHFGTGTLNSLFIGTVVTLASLVIGVLSCLYALARLNFKFKYLAPGFILGLPCSPASPSSPRCSNSSRTSAGWARTRPWIIPNISFVLPLTVYTHDVLLPGDAVGARGNPARVDGCARQDRRSAKVITAAGRPGHFTTAILAFISSAE